MPDDRTLVTELGTALGMLGFADVDEAITRRPAQMEGVPDADWARLTGLHRHGTLVGEFVSGFANGRAFLASPDALNGRIPRIVEWTGGRRPPGDEVAPADLRVDHVYMVSCKYLSKILHNASPSRLFEGLLGRHFAIDGTDWYERVAPDEYQLLFTECVAALGLSSMPNSVLGLSQQHRRALAASLKVWPPSALSAYADLCEVVSRESAVLWQHRLRPRGEAERTLWRLLRMGSTPYFILGVDRLGSVRLRIDTPWDWRQSYRLVRLQIEAAAAGQPRVNWSADIHHHADGTNSVITGHVEIRWSHGRFARPPEAKVYLDTPHYLVPGYHTI